MKHYITKYEEDDQWYAEAWLQINLFGQCFCFWKRRIPIDRKSTFYFGDDIKGIQIVDGDGTLLAFIGETLVSTNGDIKVEFVKNKSLK